MTTLQASPARSFRTIALVGRYQTAGVADTLAAIDAFLAARGLRVLLEAGTAEAVGRADAEILRTAEIGDRADLAIVVGGDGTMLGIARELACADVPLVGINHGRLGFMTDIPLARWRESLGEILDGRHESDTRTLLSARVMRGDDQVFSALALNDVVVARGASGRMIELLVEVDGLYVYTQRADGLIVASPTGSTAYALSANGPILHPGVAGFVLAPVAPQALSNRPIVLPEQCCVSIRVTDSRDAHVNCDMQTFAAVEPGDRILVERAPCRIEFLHPTGWSYYKTLRRKLNWYAPPADWNPPPGAPDPAA